MNLYPPFVKNITINATWSGNLASPVSVEIIFNVAAKSTSHLELVHTSHPSVLRTHVASIRRVSQCDETASDVSPATCFFQTHTRSPNSPRLLSKSQQEAREHTSCHVSGEGQERLPNILATRECVKGVPEYHETYQVRETQQNPTTMPFKGSPSPPAAPLPVATDDHDSTFSPSPPPTMKKVTVPKRLNVDGSSDILIQDCVQRLGPRLQEESCSPQSVQKRPLSLEKRPPWRSTGAEDTTPRGRRQLGTDRAKRKISRSMGAPRASQRVPHQRRSSLPGRMPKPAKNMQNCEHLDEPTTVQTVPRGPLTSCDVRGRPRQRDATVRISRCPEAFTASERVEKWLQDRCDKSPATDSSSAPLTSESEGYFRSPHLTDALAPSLSPSPSPSSRAALPWTPVPGIRGGGPLRGVYGDIPQEMPLPTVVNDNGSTFVFFQESSTGDSLEANFLIKIHAAIKLEAQAFGCHSLAVPGLPLSNGNAEGTLNLSILGSPSCNDEAFEAGEKVAYIDEDLVPRPFHQGSVSQRFRLDMPFQLDLLCFETCRILDATEFEVDAHVRTRFDWENLNEEGLSAEHTMICAIRLHPFLMWAENVKFDLYLIGGPAGTLEMNLEAGNRRIYLDGKHCNARHGLRMSLTCPVIDLQKPFILSWEKLLGMAPFEVWLPRIAGRRCDKLDEIFDLPQQGDMSVTPDLCRKSRRYSMAAQDCFFKSSGRFSFFPENQLTPNHVFQSLREHSGRFYEELTAGSVGSGSESATYPLHGGERSARISKQRSWRRCAAQLWSSPLDGNGLSKSAERNPGSQPESKPAEVGHVDAAPVGGESSATHVLLWPLRVTRWCLRKITLRRPLTFILAAWLCFGVWFPEHQAQIQSPISATLKEAWKTWDFQPVQLHGDVTGWKHLMAKVSHSGSKMVEDEHIDVGASIDIQPERSELVTETNLEVSEGAMAQVTTSKTAEEGPWETSTTREDEETGAKDMTLRDRIDLALGWRPLTGS